MAAAHTGMTGHTVPIGFVRAAVSSGRRRGIAVDDWLDAAGISPRLLDDDRSRITVEQVSALMRALWKSTDDEMFGLAPMPVPRGTFQLISLGLVNAPDAGTVLRRLCDFSKVLPGLPEVTLCAGETDTKLSVDTGVLNDPEHLLTPLLLSTTHRFAGWLIGRRIPLREVELPYPSPASTTDYDLLFGCALRFDATTAGFSFDNSVLSAPIVQDDRTLAEYIRNSPADLLSRRDYGSALSDRVRKILQRGIGGDWPTSAEIAGKLAMSEQHMRRTLRDEETSLSQIRDELLRDAAIASLAAGKETVTALSRRLGFSEPSAFHRAFRRWTGSPVSAYRKR